MPYTPGVHWLKRRWWLKKTWCRTQTISKYF